ncbi:DUF5615 family PIN-like protein [Candidatus Peregrinibacteria bacterium]|nr:DUF5615 family PIN-like protein [Candidatus Peregrinibacteria bacterium]
MLKFLVDHNIPKSVSNFLKKQKYDVKLVKDVDPEMSDDEVLQLAVKEKRIVVSNDKDFVNLSLKYDKINIILFDYLSQQADVRIKALSRVLPDIKLPFGILIIFQ